MSEFELQQAAWVEKACADKEMSDAAMQEQRKESDTVLQEQRKESDRARRVEWQ